MTKGGEAAKHHTTVHMRFRIVSRTGRCISLSLLTDYRKQGAPATRDQRAAYSPQRCKPPTLSGSPARVPPQWRFRRCHIDSRNEQPELHFPAGSPPRVPPQWRFQESASHYFHSRFPSSVPLWFHPGAEPRRCQVLLVTSIYQLQHSGDSGVRARIAP